MTAVRSPAAWPGERCDEQLLLRRARTAHQGPRRIRQKGIARGRSIVAAIYDVGVVMVAENPSASLYKISEIYDRIAFAGVGKYNEFDRLREAGIRWADGTGYTYSREDVDARALANYYAQHLGDMFTEGQKPSRSRSLWRSWATSFVRRSSIGSPTKGPFGRGGLRGARWRRRDHQGAFRRPRGRAPVALADAQERRSRRWPADRELPVSDLEVGVLEDRGDRRTFARLGDDQIASLLT